MYAENLCENCERGPYICKTRNCESDRVIKNHPIQTLTITNNTELVIVEAVKPTHFEYFQYLS